MRMTPLKSLRLMAGLTQAELGNAVGVSQTSVWQWERGVNGPSTTVLRRVAAALNVTTDQLLDTVERTIKQKHEEEQVEQA